MNLVSVFKAMPGMVLARDVKNKDGRHLIDAGTPLGAKEIRTLKMWGVLEISVQANASGELDSSQKTAQNKDGKVNAFLVKWFRHNKLKDPVVNDIYDICQDWFESHPDLLKDLLVRLNTRPGKQAGEKTDSQADPSGLLADNVKLPALPKIYSQINAAVQDPRCSGKDIADIVSKDTSLSATLLKIVNSAYYGFPEKIDSLAYAAMALGTQQICTLAMGITVINYFKGMPETALDMEAFWKHSVGCAITAKSLTTHVAGVNPERVFIGGLLHDMGRLVFLNHFPGAAGSALFQARKLNLSLFQVEPRHLQMTHAQFGSQLSESWNFSSEISALIRDHHGDFKETPGKEVAIVYFSNWLVTALGIGSSGEIALPRLDMKAWEAMDVSPGALVPVIRQMDREIMEAIRFFYE